MLPAILAISYMNIFIDKLKETFKFFYVLYMGWEFLIFSVLVLSHFNSKYDITTVKTLSNLNTASVTSFSEDFRNPAVIKNYSDKLLMTDIFYTDSEAG